MESDIKQSGDLYSLLGWLDKNRKQIISTSVVVVLVGIVVAYIFWRKDQKEIAAGEALAAVMLAGDRAQPSTDALLKIVEGNAGTAAAGRALLVAAGQEFADGKVDKAAELFQRFLREYEGNPLTSQAKFGIATCLESQGKAVEATTAFKEIVDRFGGDNIATPAKFSLARLYEAQGKLEPARDLFMDLARASQGTFGMEAVARLTAMFQNHPDLRPGAVTGKAAVPTNSPPAP